MATIKAQVLYDLREETGFCSGEVLSDFFREELDGEPSPSGNVEVDAKVAIDFVFGCCKALRANGTPFLEAWKAFSLLRWVLPW